MHLYESNVPSGNAYKVKLLLAHLGLDYQITTLDILATPSETRTPSFLALNPDGRIPLLLLDDGTPLAESNAILFYLAEGTPLLPASKVGRAKALQWLFFEQNQHEPTVAVYKAWTYWGQPGSRCEHEVKKLKEKGQAALDVMEKHLAGKRFFVEDVLSIADIALYAYTSEAEAVGFTIGENVQRWLEEVKNLKGHVKIKASPNRNDH